jgi:uncharacterized oligopeptide transporter (OPT) family protein
MAGHARTALSQAAHPSVRPALAEKTVVSVASGLIAGETLMGIVIALLIVSGVLAK